MRDWGRTFEQVSTGVRLTEIEIVPVKPKNGLLAFANFILNKRYFVGDVAIHCRLSQPGYRLVYPSKLLQNGVKVNIFHPIRKDVGREIEKQVCRAFDELLLRVESKRDRGGEEDGQHRKSTLSHCS